MGRNEIRRKMFLVFLPLTIATFICPGCLVMGDKTEYLRKNEETKKIELESEEAGRLFHRQRRRAEHCTSTSYEHLIIPFICACSKSIKLSSNARYNDEINRCDVNGDGIITLIEARAYSDYSEEPKKK